MVQQFIKSSITVQMSVVSERNKTKNTMYGKYNGPYVQALKYLCYSKPKETQFTFFK